MNKTGIMNKTGLMNKAGLTNKAGAMRETSPLGRRRFLKWSSMSLAAAGLSSGMPPFFQRAIAAPGASNKKILFIFLRGGVDGIQTIIPFGDAGDGPDRPNYSVSRPNLAIAPAQAHDLNGFASFFPSLQDATASGPKCADIFHGNVDERPGQLAVMHRVGYASQNRSHFSSQQFWENGVPGALNLEEGVFNRFIQSYRRAESPMQAVTLNNNQMVMMKGEVSLPVLRSVNDFALPSNVPLGTPPTGENPLGTGLMGAYGQEGFNLSRSCNKSLYDTGVTLLDSLQFFEDNVRNEPYAPEPDAAPYYAAISNAGFRSYVADCARLLKQVPSLQIAGCNQGGYDTHGRQDVAFPNLMRDLGLAMTALYHDLKPIWDDTIVVTMSEFGRTSAENGNRGTDHGESTFMLAMGGSVLGGVHNCDASTWENGAMYSSPSGRYLAHRTDFRQIYAQIVQQHLGDPESRIDDIIPGYTSLASENLGGYFSPIPLFA